MRQGHVTQRTQRDINVPAESCGLPCCVVLPDTLPTEWEHSLISPSFPLYAPQWAPLGAIRKLCLKNCTYTLVPINQYITEQIVASFFLLSYSMTELTSHNPYHLPNSTNDRSSLFPVAQEIVVLLIFRNAIQLCLCVCVCLCTCVSVDGFHTWRRVAKTGTRSRADRCQSRLILQRTVAVVKSRAEEEEKEALSLFLIYRFTLSPCLLITPSLPFRCIAHRLPRLMWRNFGCQADPQLQTLPFSFAPRESDVFLLIARHLLEPHRQTRTRSDNKGCRLRTARNGSSVVKSLLP